MLEALMKWGGHRVDYVNERAQGQHGAYGFYVRGYLPAVAPYRSQAKIHLYAGLNVIQARMNPKLLVAVYVDVDHSDNLLRPAYLQLKRDLLAGKFNRVFVYRSTDLLGSPAATSDFQQHAKLLGGVSLITFDHDSLTEMDMNLESAAELIDCERMCA